MTEAAVSFAGNLTDDPEVRHVGSHHFPPLHTSSFQV
jgi:hypothetical protein